MMMMMMKIKMNHLVLTIDEYLKLRDGKANKGPKAGKFWGEMAEELVKNTFPNNK